jgi:hypothetical protein
VFLDHVEPTFFLPPVTHLPACINLITYGYPSALFLDTLGCEVCFWVDLFTPAVMSCHTSLPSFMILSLSCGLFKVVVFHPSGRELTVVVV